MGRRRQLGFLGLAAFALFLPGTLRAQAVADGTVSVIHVPEAARGLRVEWAATDGWSNDWEVAVTFDAAHCDVYCAIRRKRDALGRVPAMDLLLPPAVAVRVFSDSVAVPFTVTVDPAGRTAPAAVNRSASFGDSVCTVGKREFAVSSAAAFQRDETPATAQTLLSSPCCVSASPAGLPLRI
jgi:hypothetical protein